jgi:hypothetical protein
VPAGLLDDDINLEVGAHLFVGSKDSWDRICFDGPKHETMPELWEFIQLMRGGG